MISPNDISFFDVDINYNTESLSLRYFLNIDYKYNGK